MSDSFTITSPVLLNDLIEIVVDWHVPDGDAAKRFTIRQPPGNGLILIAQYRKPAEAKWQFGLEVQTCNEHQFAGTLVQSGVVNIKLTAPFGATAIYIRPEAAISVFGCLKEFANAKVDLRDVFRAGELERLYELLAGSQKTPERLAHIETFLLRNARRSSGLSAARHAARSLRSRPGLRRSRLAEEMSISERHLSRLFLDSFGISPKRFAKIARIEKLMAGCRNGLDWLDVAYGCGFCDQSHMIRDFKEIIGQSPGEFFRALASGPRSLAGGSNSTFAITEAPCT